jgi:formate dehydrogenase major subunit
MKLTRREFLKVTGIASATLFLDLGFDLSPVEAQARELKIKYAQETPTICPYCGCGCGIIVHTRDGKVIYTEGDPNHPINRGALCSKGSSLYQVAVNERRMKKPLYRAPGSDKWEEKDWDWVLDQIAQKVKETRDATFITKENGIIANRTDAIACLGGAALDNEECYLLSKLMRSLGIVYLEHQARI